MLHFGCDLVPFYDCSSQGKLYSTLGLLSDVYPNEFTDTQIKLLAQRYVRTVETELKSQREVQKKLIEGIFLGLASFLNNFSHMYQQHFSST